MKYSRSAATFRVCHEPSLGAVHLVVAAAMGFEASSHDSVFRHLHCLSGLVMFRMP